MTHSNWTVHKFGGSSLATADCFRRVADILDNHAPARLGVVLSACRGATDMLLGLVVLAESQDDACAMRLAELRALHVSIAETLLKPPAAAVYCEKLDADLRDIAGILNSVRLIRAAADNIRDLIAGFGEIWSTRLFTQFYRERGKRPGEVRWIDARRVVVVDPDPLGPRVDWEASQRRFDSLVERNFSGTLIITGFIASDRQDIQTTLGRNGSDFSGSIFGALCNAREIYIWTDVDGVLSADPRLVPDAQVIDSLSYDEAAELAYFGAKVIHPQTMAPATTRRIPIHIRNTFAPEKPGTVICAESSSRMQVKGITSISNIALFSLEGTGALCVPSTAHRLFGALRDERVSVVMLSQASSEHSICFAIPEAQATRAEVVVRRTFDGELRQGQIKRVEVVSGSSILAVVGDGMAEAHVVAAQVFGMLSKSDVKVRAIAQGASERNISVVIDGHDTTRALRCVHAGLYLSPHTISIGVIGPGAVGSVLIDQLASESERLRRELQLDLRVRGILTSQRMFLASEDIDLKNWRDCMAASSEPTDLERFVNHLHAGSLPHTVLIDCTASAEIAGHYCEWLQAGVHIVTPNKKANSASLSSFCAIQEARRGTGVHYLYEATVGAGLPIITTVRDLLETGDRIRSIEGLLSGTLAYLFSVYDGREPFSAIVKEAKAKGYTEPDPRDDLSGLDVTRKLVILGREMGLPLEMEDVAVESLVPAALENCSIDEFLERLPQYDAAMLRRFEAAKAKGKLLRYVGRLDARGVASVGLVEIDAKHSFATTALTDNVVRFETDRYCDNPLVVQGPGAGPAVTAARVFADLLRVSAYLGTKLGSRGQDFAAILGRTCQ